MKKYGFTIVNSYYDSSHMSYNGLSRTFQWLWKAVGNNLDKYTGFPKMVGECGGKNYHFVHPTAEVETVVASTIRSAFEYQVGLLSFYCHLGEPEAYSEIIHGGGVKNLGGVSQCPPLLS